MGLRSHQQHYLLYPMRLPSTPTPLPLPVPPYLPTHGIVYSIHPKPLLWSVRGSSKWHARNAAVREGGGKKKERRGRGRGATKSIPSPTNQPTTNQPRNPWQQKQVGLVFLPFFFSLSTTLPTFPSFPPLPSSLFFFFLLHWATIYESAAQ